MLTTQVNIFTTTLHRHSLELFHSRYHISSPGLYLLRQDRESVLQEGLWYIQNVLKQPVMKMVEQLL